MRTFFPSGAQTRALLGPEDRQRRAGARGQVRQLPESLPAYPRQRLKSASTSRSGRLLDRLPVDARRDGRFEPLLAHFLFRGPEKNERDDGVAAREFHRQTREAFGWPALFLPAAAGMDREEPLRRDGVEANAEERAMRLVFFQPNEWIARLIDNSKRLFYVSGGNPRLTSPFIN